MALPPNGYVSNNSGPVIPTGYESLDLQTQRKRKLAEALLAQGMAGPGPNARSWTQLLGSLAQAWAGKSMTREADKAEAQIQNDKLGDYQTVTRAFDEDVKAGTSPQDMIARYGGNPYTKERAQMYADVLEERMKSQGKFKDPVRLQGADGNFSTYLPNEAGEFKPLDGGLQMGPKMENINGVAMALQEAQPGKILPQDPNNLGILGPDGKPMINEQLLGAKTQIAKAGAPSVSTVLNNQMAKELPGAVVENVQKSRESAETSAEMLPNIARARVALKKAITGFAANQRLDLARLGNALGLNGDEAVQSSQQLLQALGSQMFPILAALRPASDTDVQTAKMMSGGDLTLSPGAILSAIDAADRAARANIVRHNKKVDGLVGIYGGDPSVGATLETFRADESALRATETTAQRAQRILQERRTKGGAGASSRTFP